MSASEDEGETEIIRNIKQITAFPTVVNFPPTFVNVLSNFTVYFSNPYHKKQKVTLVLDGDSEFSIANDSFCIESGSIYSCVLTFAPKTEGSFSTILKAYCEGSNPCISMVSGKSVASPLAFPVEIVKEFVFDDASTECNFEVENRSKYKELHIVMTTNTPAFIINTPVFDLKPNEMNECSLIFDPTKAEDISSDPMLNVQCSESGDSLDVPLTIGMIRNTITIDFGNSSIGQFKKQVLTIPQSSSIIHGLEDDSPFALMFDEQSANATSTELCIDDDPKREITVDFETTKEGTYEEIVEFDSFFLQLKGACFKPFYSIQAPESFGDPVIITNISKKTHVCAVSFSETYETSTNVKILAGKSKEIQLGSEKSLFISWNNGEDPVFDRYDFFTENNSIVTDESLLGARTVLTTSPGKNTLPITLNNDGDVAKRVSILIENPDFSIDDDFRTLVLEPHSMQSVSVSFSPQKSTATTASLTVIDEDAQEELTTLQLHGAMQLISDKSFIPFFGIDEEISTKMTVSGAKSVFITAPEWVNAPEKVKSGRRFTVSCSKIPKSSIGDRIVLESDFTAPTTIPVIAYMGSSDISFKSPEPLHRSKNGVQFTTIDVVNNGIRPGFVVFSCDSEDNASIKASPPSAVIPAGKTKTFKFVVDKYNSGECTVVMHSGDEILRQMRSFFKPSSFYCTSFEDVKTRNEIGEIVEYLQEVNEKQFAKIFKKSVNQQRITFSEEETIPEETIIHEFVSMPDFSLSESEIDFGYMIKGNNATKTVWLENTSNEVIDLELSCDNQMLSFPETLHLIPSQQVRLCIKLECQEEAVIDEYIEIEGTVDSKAIHINAVIEEPMVQVDTMDFGCCPIGRIARGKLAIINRRKTRVTLSASVCSPFILKVKDVIIEPQSFVKFPIHFIPKTVGLFQEELEFASNDVHPFSVTLLGRSEISLDV